MNPAERNVVTILTIARLVENTLAYCTPSQNTHFSAEDRKRRGEALKSLTAKNTPFAVNCENNGEQGKKLAEDMEYFIEDVYGENGRIVSVDLNQNVRVEQSLTIELFTTIVRLRLFLEGFLTSAEAFLKKENLLEPVLADCIHADVRLYHALAGKICSTLLFNKFIEINQNANTYAQSYSKSHGGIDPRKDSHFSIDDDPSVRMLKNEFKELNQDLVNVLNTYGNDDEEFRFARQSLYADCELFTGKKHPTDIDAFRRIFTSYFDKIVRSEEGRVNNCFKALGEDMAKPDSVKEESKEETK